MKALQKFMSVFIVLCICVSMAVPFSASAAVVITNKSQLFTVKNDLSKDYVLGADIVFTEKDFVSGGQFYGGGGGFEPIGTADKPFTGTFDGRGYMIKGLKINRPSAQYVGMFGYVTGTVKNIALVDADITGGYYTGGIVGYEASGAVVTQCYTSAGTVRSEYAGGRMGGLAGFVGTGATLSNSYNTAKVEFGSGKSGYAAGIAGENRTEGRIANCYNAAVLGDSAKYGIVATGDSLYVSSSYSINASEFCTMEDDLNEYPSRWRSDAQFRDKANLSGFDFTNIWKYDAASEYPYPMLKANPHKKTAKTSGSFASGTGTVYDPYVIATTAQFSMIANDPYACYKLATNPTLTDSFKTIPVLEGILYGNGRTISTTSPLFAENRGRIENVSVNSQFTKSANVGSVAVKNSNTISDCNIGGVLTGTNAGGVCYENTGRILGCSMNAAVTASNGAAGGAAAVNTGLIGYINLNVVNRGTVTSGKGTAGGIAGVSNKPGIIRYSENYGAVTGVAKAGGIVGELGGEINTAANYGDITASGTAGGIAGTGAYTSKCTIVHNSGYIDAQTAGGIVGENCGIIIHVINSGTVHGKKTAGGIAGTNSKSPESSVAVGKIQYAENCGIAAGEGTVAAIAGVNNTTAVIEYGVYLQDAPYCTGSETAVRATKQLTRAQFADPEVYYMKPFFNFPSIWESVAAFPNLKAFPYKAVTGITLDKNTAGGLPGKTIVLKADVVPQDATFPDITWSSSNSAAATVDGSGTVTVKSGGTAVIKAVSNGRNASCTVQGTVIERLAGFTRIETANVISNKGWTSANTVVLANSLNYSDALAGVPYAAYLDAPILLTAGRSLEPEVAAQIKKLGAKKVVIIGGPGVISADVENTLKKTVSVERICGFNRYSTSYEIAKKFPSTSNVVVVTGTNYADALSISPYASIKRYPIIYCDPKTGLTADLNNMVKKAVSVTVVGGPGAVPDKFIPRTYTRVAGMSRYLTSYEIAKKYASSFGNDVTVATGTNFPDALAGGVLCAKLKTPLLLSNQGYLISEMQSFIKGRNPSKIYVLGGPGAVPDSTFDSLF